MSERPENSQDNQPTSQGGWHSPGETSPWQSPDTQTAASVAWREVKALPDDVEKEPEKRGMWHLPQESDTTFNPDDVVEVSDAPRQSLTSNIASPEDLLAEIIGGTQKTVAAPRPEDFDYSTSRGEEATAASDVFAEGETLLVDEEEMTVDAEPLPDLDDEAFSMSEYMALANLAQGDDDDLAGLNASDFSPSERAAYSAALNVANELDSKQEQALKEPAVPEDATVTMDDTSEQPASQAAEYARKQLEELGQSGDDPGAYTQQPQQPQQPQYTQEEIQLAQQFRETKRQVAILRQMEQQGQIDYNELQARLQQHQIYDAQGNWWMVGYESDEWYRFNNQSQEWEAAQPPVSLDAGQVRTETGLGEAAPDVLPDSLPYLPQDGSGAQEFSDSQTLYDDYDDTQYSQSQQAYNQQFPVDEPPIRYPNQPTNDPNMTQVGSTFDATQIHTGSEPTYQNMPAVDPNATMQSGSFQDTMPSSGTPLGDLNYGDDNYGQGIPQAEPEYTDDGYTDYDAQGEATPDYDALAGERQGNMLRFIGIGVVTLLIVGLIGVGIIAFLIQNQYTTIVQDWQDEIAALGTEGFDFQTATILAADGTVIAELTGEEGERVVVSIENGDVSPYFIHAIVSSEDPRFYENSGVDLLAIVRAFWQNYTSGEVQSGASTITQQIVRDRILGTRDVTLNRKFLEALLAIEVANSYSKNEILDIYINEFFYGEQSYGVEAAAQFYFDTSAADLDVAQSATLVGILPSPSNSNPVVAPTAAFDNMRVILDRMVETNCLNFQHGEWGAQGVPFCINENTMVDGGSGQEFELFRRNPDGTYGGLLAVQIAQVETRRYAPRQSDIQYPHFVYYVLGELDEAYGDGAYIERGFTVRTTLIPRIQNAAESALQQGVDSLGINGAQTGAAIVIDPSTGAILAMVGSPDFNDSEIDGQNNNTIAPQQPGSAIKPVVYATALTGVNGNYFTPASILWDVPSQYNIGGQIYEPTNYDNQYRGPVSVRHALSQSLNIPAVKTFAAFDTPAFVSMANNLGIQFAEDATFGLPTAIGATEVSLMDLTHAYATIANDGLRSDLFAIEEIQERGVNATDRPVELALVLVPADPLQAISPEVAYLLQNILSDEVSRTETVNGVPSSFFSNSPISGASLGLSNQNQVGVKTGTNNTVGGNPSRIWTVGFTNNYAVGVWMGTLNEGTPMRGNVSGLTGAAPVWNAIMAESLDGVNPGAFERPGGVVGETVCRLTGVLDPDAVTDCPVRVGEIFLQTQPPPAPENGYVATLSIDSWTGLRANEWCRDYVVVETYSNIADPFAMNWLNGTGRGQQILSQLALPNNLQAPPQGECQQGQTLPSVLISFPQENTVLEGQVAFTGQVSASDLQRWEIQISEVGTDNFRSIMPQPATNQVPSRGTPLFDWDSTSVPNGAYFIRLEAISTSGGYIQYEVRVTVSNPEPTPVPSLPTPISIDVEPLPFATDTPSAP